MVYALKICRFGDRKLLSFKHFFEQYRFGQDTTQKTDAWPAASCDLPLDFQQTKSPSEKGLLDWF
jgi:hypothetical protein